jgi:hypothetical protein
MVRLPLLLAFALAAFAFPSPALADAPAPELPPQPAVHPQGIPAGAVLVSPCIATMGEHWVELKDAPMGPIYGVWQGKPIFTEIMVTADQLAQGFAYVNLHALPGYTIDHVDFKFEPKGHAGLPVPHYDLHAYYITPAVQATICPGGMPDSSMKAMNHP